MENPCTYLGSVTIKYDKYLGMFQELHILLLPDNRVGCVVESCNFENVTTLFGNAFCPVDVATDVKFANDFTAFDFEPYMGSEVREWVDSDFDAIFNLEAFKFFLTNLCTTHKSRKGKLAYTKPDVDSILRKLP